ncbi:bifunctional aminoglycoside phosphotransferase/ATP-binding protein [Hyphomicrobium sp.]|uniref:bifunctional aminoglycoside phosphotransferase/ATP-binding protein n=1 Tax=Hyphomicrobium sp. TaxID=82 RepID=UPI0025BDB680|nr:bifunctional aminoglycoside phosphotransferase/ATP-binding protein [Hyphomicrobium sp.]MCC7251792.1 AAA family ATPase [Hyphomicrobium sp.]
MPRDRHPHDLAEPDREAAELMAFLTDPASYADRPDRIETIETHAARVILAGDKAFKIKKRVKLPFLNFTTLAERQRALARELELNRDQAPEIYIGLVDIGRQPDGTLAFGTGDPVEAALAMHRFDQEQLLAHVAEQGPLPREIGKALADMAVRYHRAAPLVLGLSGAAIMHDTVANLAASLVDAAPPAVQPRADEFHRRSLAEVERLAPLLDARGQAGHVRRCHGDLHLGNIVMLDGRVVPFDALEFDERLATIDVLYDLAFLLMDLDVRGYRNAANVVLNAYVGAAPTGHEIEGLAALPLFLATRAAVRGLVALESALQNPQGDDTQHIARATAYITAANRYLTPVQPTLIAVGGLSGTGKSTLAAHLAPIIDPSPGALILRTDVERKHMFATPETERLSPEHYSEQVSDRVYAALYAKAEHALAAGHSVIFDGVSAKPEERESIAAIAKRTGARFAGLWLEAPLATQIARVEARRGDASDSDAAVVCAQAERNIGPLSWTRIDAGRTPEHTLDQARRALAAL